MVRTKFHPGGEAELSAMIAQTRSPVSIQGGGTRGFAGRGDVLSTTGFSDISLYEPGSLTMVAQAGTPVAEINAALAKNNQRLAFEPTDHRELLGTKGEPTIGGVFAANVSGPRRIAVGAARDFLLGVRFVDGSGTVIKNGGRVMKNVTGYDLVKLLAGSFGTLGILTEVSFKVLPLPETQSTLVLHGLSDDQAVRTMAKALGSPFEVSGAGHDPASNQTLLRIEGFEDSVAYRIGRLQELLGHNEMDVLAADLSAERWTSMRDVSAFAGQSGDVWRIACKPSEAPRLIEASGAEAHIMDWGGGLMWVCLDPGTDLRANLGSFDGHATLVRADAETKARLGVFHPQPHGVAQITSGLRARFDPKGILNAPLSEIAP